MDAMGDWRDKDDLDLTADDLSDMLDEGAPVKIVGPRLPSWATRVSAVPSFSAGHTEVRVAGSSITTVVTANKTVA
jgi:hypothetical protein